MAALNPNNTARLFFDYVTGDQSTSKEHTVMWRMAPGAPTVAAAQGLFTTFMGLIGASNLKQGWRVLRVRAAQAGSDITLPQALTSGLAAFVGTSTTGYTQNREAEEWSWQARSYTSGRRLDFSLYGITVAPPTNFRFPAGGTSPAWVATTVAALNSSAHDAVPVAIDNSRPTWYAYVNEQNNSYWEAQIRRG